MFIEDWIQREFLFLFLLLLNLVSPLQLQFKLRAVFAELFCFVLSLLNKSGEEAVSSGINKAPSHGGVVLPQALQMSLSKMETKALKSWLEEAFFEPCRITRSMSVLSGLFSSLSLGTPISQVLRTECLYPPRCPTTTCVDTDSLMWCYLELGLSGGD